jgi:hypothetical protein
VRFTDEQKYFVSEASVYRLLKAHDLITGPAYVVIKAANEFKARPRALITSPSCTSHGFSQTMAHLTWRAIWPGGSRTTAWSMKFVK